MRAAVFKAPGQPLVIEQVNDPQPGPTDLVIKVRDCGVCGTDLHWSECKDDSHGYRLLPAGAVMGHEFAGEVVEVGVGSRDRFKPGDRVCALPFIGCGRCSTCLIGKPHRCAQVTNRASADLTGAYAEFARIGAAETLMLPDGVDFKQGALIEPLAVGLHAVNRARLGPQDSVLIVGAGPVGLAVATWCRFVGAREVIVSDLVHERAERSTRFGATACIDASRENVRERARQIVGRDVSVVFDCVGVPGSLQLAMDYADIDSRVVVVGLCMAVDRVLPAKAIVKELEVIFAFVYRRQDFELTLDALRHERIQVADMVTRSVGFDEFPQTFEALKKPGHDIKVMLEP